jgi:hypothetical protein
MNNFTPDSYAEKVREDIKKFGFSITYVTEGDTPAFCYSTGLTESYGIPEIFISSLPPVMSSDFINSYASRFKKTSPPVGELIKSITEPFDYYLIETEPRKLEEYVLASLKYYGSKSFKYLQLIFPDTELRFPHENGYNYDQEIMGEYFLVKEV